MSSDDTLILADSNFTSIKKYTIELAKIIIKDKKYLFSTYSLKFNDIQIKLNLNRIVLTKKKYIRGIFLVIDHVTDFINSRAIIRKKLSFKK